MIKKNKSKWTTWIILYTIQKPDDEDVTTIHYTVSYDIPKKKVFEIAERDKPDGTLFIYVMKSKLVGVNKEI